ncbi:MAG: MiaB/RimO family radical SAM methylthiotransferase [Candidatus Margulisbacteria bacterium]|jgi:tRNA-2-methylthio-N6-dimethylallyladenosine synthase|nr:MiaB/RimO family radical SAM methylthiotransferase [Candidatus Margulisiibacteriota bacterium]
MPRYYIKTYGCQANVHDAAKLAGVLEAAGYQSTSPSDYQNADIILVLTCVVRQNAEDRAAWFVQSLKGAKKLNPNLKIALCGCLVTEPGRDVKKQFPHVDLFVPPNSPEVLTRFLRPPVPQSPSPLVPQSPFVSIMNGCDNYCSYCVVPYVRGHETSRPLDDVLAEIKGLIEQGVTDITLLGQNVNSYRFGLSNLLTAVQSFDICHLSFVIRFMTSHPKDLSDDLIKTVADLPYVAKEFHLPLQSGDNEILKAMNRGYTVEYYLGRVRKIRELIPNARITSDLLVGFPGETAAQFQNTLQVLEKVRFKAVNMFAYSPRPMTAAAQMPGQVPDEVKQARLQKLIETNRALLL